MRLLRRLLYLLHSRLHERELAEELETHRRFIEDAHAARGDPDAAHAARRQMGNVTLMQEEARAVWFGWVDGCAQDLRYAIRTLRNQRGFATLAVSALALGSGLNTSLFTVFNAVALRPWPVRDPDRMVIALSAPAQRPGIYGGFSFAEYRYLRDHTRTFSGLVLVRNEGVALEPQANGSRVSCDFVTGNYFRVLGIDMAAGRGFTPEEDRAGDPQAVVVINHELWQSRYGADPNILGRRILVDEVPFTVVGVASEGFAGTSQVRHEIWIPIAALPLARPKDDFARNLLVNPNYCCSEVSGRLAPGVTRRQAEAELRVLATQFRADMKQDARNVVLTGTAFLQRPNSKRKTALPVMLLLMA
ncbi:MAG TPA: ABC transporter permease, partial [Bryobacteraceae bacterium]|nr:ABC transporter permease [Bryobacteraceae bacterium]